jgi:4-amino-4-deoxy-L-arabinose transferase-like glycosyltransferase
MAFNIFEKILPPILYARLKGKKKSTPKVSRLAAKGVKKSPPKAAPAVKTSFGGGRLVLLVLSLALAIRGQLDWVATGQDLLFRGSVLFGLAILLLTATLWPWRGETPQDFPFPSWLERGLLFFILLLAAFFRIYRLDQMPPGIFIDQGIAGDIALRILHEHYFPIYADPVFRNPPFLMYQLAVWFAFLKVTPFTFYLFFALMSLATVVFVYWTVRQLGGPRLALLAAFILAVMRWNINFARNGFPTTEVPFYMFGTLAFLLYGLRTGKKWSFALAACFCAGGLYTYQAYKVVPPLLLVFGLYKFFADRQNLRRNVRGLLLFTGLSLLLMSPFIILMFQNQNNWWREENYNIFQSVKEKHSLQPVVDMVTRTARMFNREGDNNNRHNKPSIPMLDNVTGSLFVLGFFFALTRLKKEKYFFAAAGFLGMCLPCLLSQDAAHANRMLGTTPFIAILSAFPLAVVWDRIRSKWGGLGELFLALLLIEPLFYLALQNYNNYFELQAGDNSLWSTDVWSGYSVPETRIGEKIMAEGENFDYYLMPRFYDYPTIDFLGYSHKDRIKKMVMPEDFAPFKTDPTRGVCYAMLRDHSGVLSLLKKLYPTGTVEEDKDPKGQVMVEYFKIPPTAVAAARGLDGAFPGKIQHFPRFPKDLPDGPYQAIFKGNLFVDNPGTYRFTASANGSVSLLVNGRPVTKTAVFDLARGFYPIQVRLKALSGPPVLAVNMTPVGGEATVLDDSNLTVLDLNHGLKGEWFPQTDPVGKPALVQWSPVLNFPHGDDFNFISNPLCIRWRGTLKVSETGTYGFEGKTDEAARLVIDGKTVWDWTANGNGRVHLKAGRHTIEVGFRKNMGPIFSLYWKPPSATQMTVIPMEAFGDTQ